MLLEDFSNAPETRWIYVADTVMGGVSRGQIAFGRDGDRHFVRLTGRVSTDNNGGFIQVRSRLERPLASGLTALRLQVRGNGATYHVFLRSVHGFRPWHSYRASFVAGADWHEVILPFAGFERSRDELPPSIVSDEVTGIGLLGYGADYDADVSVASIHLE